MLKIQNITKAYGANTVLSDFSFEIDKNGVYGLLGPNGAGKSTIMNVVTGYIGVKSGDVLIDGASIFEEPERARKSVGYLPELPPVYADMTPREYLRYVCRLKKIPSARINDCVEKSIAALSLGDYRERLIKNLSKGYRQRVGIAQAILGDPSLVILDEPMVGLDPKQIVETRELIKRLGEGRVVLLSSHVLQDVASICDEVLIISRGVLVARDTPENLENKASENQTLAIEIRGGWPEVEPVLKGLGITDIERVSPTAEDTVRFVLKAQNAPSDQLMFALTKAGLPLVEMARSRATLEDIFIELTDAASARKAAEE